MPSQDALVGFGMPHNLAALIGANPSTLTCAGTAQATAATIKSKSVELTAAASQTGAILPSSTNNNPYFVFNSSATAAVVYVPVGDTLNGSLNGSLSVAQNKSALFYQYKPHFWQSFLTA